MDQKTKEEIKLKVMDQQRKAYEIAKALMSISNKYTSYNIQTKIYLQSDKIIPVTTIKEYPESRISFDTSEEDLNFLKTVVIDNMEGAD